MSLMIFVAISSLAIFAMASCGPQQATVWGAGPSGFRSPSHPWKCTNIYTVHEPMTYSEVRREFELTPYELLSWNCFLDEKDDHLATGTKICVDAEPLLMATSKFLGPRAKAPAPMSTAMQQNPPHPLFTRTSMITVTTTASTSDTVHNAKRLLTQGLAARDISSSVETSDSDAFTPTTVPFYSDATDFPNPFSEDCDAISEAAEDCRVTLQNECDKWKGEYPTCAHGKCKCKAVACSNKSECLEHKQCREDDSEPVCEYMPDLHPNKDGICRCRPKIEDCVDKDSIQNHQLCGRGIECTEKYFAHAPEFAQCVQGGRSGDVSGMVCKCQPALCDYNFRGNGTADVLCNSTIVCAEGQNGFCTINVGKVVDDMKDGHCTCDGGPGPVKDSEDGDDE